jgi:coproporphyrinogen III oxidase
MTPHPPGDLQTRAAAYFRGAQERLVAGLEGLDGGRFNEDVWDRPGGGGGRARVLSEGDLFEKAGVNFSEVSGEIDVVLGRGLPGEGKTFWASGVSLVLHPRSPRVPTLHANLRCLSRGGTVWFGGGTDLTPYYVVDADVVLFHRSLRAVCDRHHDALYGRLKAWCDRYFFLPHRNEPRGVGGIFFDYFGAGAETTAGEPAPPTATDWENDPERVFTFVRDVGEHVLDAYATIVTRRRDEPWGERERDWQLLRRGRYVEFNLVYDRGTTFGLRTGGRTESILMSLPPAACWRYVAEPELGSPEAASLAAILAARDWAAARD